MKLSNYIIPTLLLLAVAVTSCELRDDGNSVADITLDQTSAFLLIGENLVLSATIAPADITNPNVTWLSSNTAVATVSNGVVTGISEGTTTVTVTTQDGGHTATSTITVVLTLPSPSENRLLPSRIFHIAEGWSCNLLFVYDDQNRIISYTHRDESADGSFSGYQVTVTYNPDGTVATIQRTDDWGTTLYNFTHSGNTITVTETWSGTDDGDPWHFEINNRGQIVRMWSEGPWGNWEYISTYNANGNLIRRVRIRGGVQESITTVEYSPTVRAVFRYTATPEWFLQLFIFGELGLIHGFMPTRTRTESNDWVTEATFTYTVENDWVQTMTERGTWEDLGLASSLSTPMMRANSNSMHNEHRLRSSINRRTAPVATSSSNGDDDGGWTWYFEYIQAR